MEIKWLGVALGTILGINIFFALYVLIGPLTGVILGALLGGWLNGLLLKKKSLSQENIKICCLNGTLTGLILAVLFWSFLTYNFDLNAELLIIGISLICGLFGGLSGLWWTYTWFK